MKPKPDNLAALEIDVATWRRDIQTFVDMTVDELNSINEQLASGFSGSLNRTRRLKAPLTLADPDGDVSPARFESRQSPHPSRTDERLNQLKRKLAMKLSVENPNF